jgi:hypothetical protein
VQVIVDDRTSRLASYTPDAVRGYRNSDDGGFWVASTQLEAADHALPASLALADIDAVAVLSDGTSRLPERYGWTWEQFMDEITAEGPAHIIAKTREAEADAPAGVYRGNTHDDATAAVCVVTHDAPPEHNHRHPGATPKSRLAVPDER